MTILDRFKKALEHEWYIQGFNAVPLYLNTAAWSGIIMKKDLGFAYDHFLFHYEKGYAEMHYSVKDIRRVWKSVEERTQRDQHYLPKIKKEYENSISGFNATYVFIDSNDLTQIKEEQLITLLHTTTKILTESVTIAHIVDACGIELEKQFKKNLFNELPVIPAKKLNEYYITLSRPTKSSFVTKEELDLYTISKASQPKQDALLREHTRKYTWIQNSYAEVKELTIDSFKKRLQSIQKPTILSPEDINHAKQTIIARHNLSEKIQNESNIIDFITTWQDGRKKNILIALGYLKKIISEISRRTQIPVDTLVYFGTTEIPNLHALKDIQTRQPTLEQRKQGVFFLMEDDQEYTISREDHDTVYNEYKQKQQNTETHAGHLNGSIANPGTAIGRVAICKGLESLNKVKRGDILVTSMTRPEFMPALKKAAAIVTDEGGITSHAAIISRELDIPAVIGTKIATKVLYDGMTVEVKANHGLVRILG